MDARQVAPVELREGRWIGPRSLHQRSLVAVDLGMVVHTGKCADLDRADGGYRAPADVTTVGTTMRSGPPMPTTRPSAASATTL